MIELIKLKECIDGINDNNKEIVKDQFDTFISTYVKNEDKKQKYLSDLKKIYFHATSFERVDEFLSPGSIQRNIVAREKGFERGKSKMLNLLEQVKNFLESNINTEINNNIINNIDYISSLRVEELKNIKNKIFDISKLLKILDEINLCYNNGSYFGLASLLRMLIDHIPPIFGFETFKEVVASYKFSKSDKKNMEHLLHGLKNISDGILHSIITNKEVLPTQQTIEYRSDIDVLLKNIILVLND